MLAVRSTRLQATRYKQGRGESQGRGRLVVKQTARVATEAELMVCQGCMSGLHFWRTASTARISVRPLLQLPNRFSDPILASSSYVIVGTVGEEATTEATTMETVQSSSKNPVLMPGGYDDAAKHLL